MYTIIAIYMVLFILIVAFFIYRNYRAATIIQITYIGTTIAAILLIINLIIGSTEQLIGSMN